MGKGKKIFIECECRDEIITFEYLNMFDEFSILLFRLNSFKRRKFIGELILSPEQAKEISDFLQKYIKKEDKNEKRMEKTKNRT